MGYRHQVISQITEIKSKHLPAWFLDKYSDFILFNGQYWASRGEYKRYGALQDFNEDAQKALIEIGTSEIDYGFKLVYFSDEGDKDIVHVLIQEGAIYESVPTEWE